MTLALDLGTTRIKLAHYDQQGALQKMLWRDAPPQSGEQGVRISDPESWLHLAAELLAEAAVPAGTTLGIASQRSSFVLWERTGGKPLTPLISWQDSRADAWCRRHSELAAWDRSGLPLSPHYAGPKLAHLLAEDPVLRRRAFAGEVLFGTLESWLLWRWSGAHITGAGIAARTTLVDLDGLDWHWARLAAYGIPEVMMPKIVFTAGPVLATVFGFPVCALLSDQAACALPVFAAHPDAMLINAGTGVFVMGSGTTAAPPGYLTALSLPTPPGVGAFIREGAVNGGVLLWQDLEHVEDAPPEACFAVGDSNGLGAPYWRADLAGFCSPGTLALTGRQQARIKAEALLFRIRQVLEALNPRPAKVLLSGGLARHPHFAKALARVLPHALFLTGDNETGLWGTAWAAEGFAWKPELPLEPVTAGPGTLDQRFGAWKQWLEQITSEPAIKPKDGP